MSHLHRGRFIKLQRAKRALGTAAAVVEVVEKVATAQPDTPHVPIGAVAPVVKARAPAKKKAKRKAKR